MWKDLINEVLHFVFLSLEVATVVLSHCDIGRRSVGEAKVANMKDEKDDDNRETGRSMNAREIESARF